MHAQAFRNTQGLVLQTTVVIHVGSIQLETVHDSLIINILNNQVILVHFTLRWIHKNT